MEKGIKKKLPLMIAAAVLIAILALLLIPGTKYSGLSTNSMEEFKSAGGLIYYDVPENAADEKFYFRSLPAYKVSLYSFTLEDGFDEYMDELSKEHEQDKWVGKQLSECKDPDYPADDLPSGEVFGKVDAADIGEYIVVASHPGGTGSRRYGIAVHPETHRFVYFYFGGM